MEPKKVLIFVMGVVMFLSISQVVGASEMSLPKATIHKYMKKLSIPNSLCKHEDLQEAKKASMVGQKARPLRLICRRQTTARMRREVFLLLFGCRLFDRRKNPGQQKTERTRSLASSLFDRRKEKAADNGKKHSAGSEAL